MFSPPCRPIDGWCPARGSWAAAHGINTVLQLPLVAFFVDSMGRLTGNSTRLAPVGTGHTDPVPGSVGRLGGSSRFGKFTRTLHAAFPRANRANSHCLRFRDGPSDASGPSGAHPETRPNPPACDHPASLHATQQIARGRVVISLREMTALPKTMLSSVDVKRREHGLGQRRHLAQAR